MNQQSEKLSSKVKAGRAIHSLLPVSGNKGMAVVLRELTVQTVGKVRGEGADVHYVWVIVQVTDNTDR